MKRSSDNSTKDRGKAAGRPGCKGDPRMNRAVSVRLENPDIPLYHALRMGGFNFPANEDSSTLDNDQVTLGQRKNQLLRRLRQLAKKKDSEQRPCQAPQQPQQLPDDQQLQQQLQGAALPSATSIITPSPTSLETSLLERANELIRNDFLDQQLQQQVSQQQRYHQFQSQHQQHYPQHHLLGPEPVQQLAMLGVQNPPLFLCNASSDTPESKRNAPLSLERNDGSGQQHQQGQGREKRPAVPESQSVEPLRSFPELASPVQQGQQQQQRHDSATGASLAGDMPSSESSTLMAHTIGNQIILPSEMRALYDLGLMNANHPMQVAPVANTASVSGTVAEEEKTSSFAAQSHSQTLLGAHLFPVPSEPSPHFPRLDNFPLPSTSEQQQLLQGQQQAHCHTSNATASATSNTSVASIKERAALHIFQQELQTLYCRSMLAAGYAPQETAEQNPLFRRFAFNAWKQECERLQSILGDDDMNGAFANSSAASTGIANTNANAHVNHSLNTALTGTSTSLPSAHRDVVSRPGSSHHHHDSLLQHPPPS